jgi:hypothetical protein
VINFSIIGELICDGAVWEFLSNVTDIVDYVKRKQGQSMYDLGYRFCQHCKKFFKVIVRKCVVCGEWLRLKPRGSDRRKYNERNRIYDKAYRWTDEPMLLQNT